MIAAGLLVVCADLVARALALDRIADPVDREAARGVWDAFLGDLRTTGWLLSGSGAVVAAAAASLIRPVDVEGPLVAAWRIVVTEPARPALRLVRGAGLVVVGVLVVLQPMTAVRLAATLAGVYVLYKGVEAIMHVLARPPAPEPADAPARRRRRRPSPRVAVSVLAAVLVGAACTAFVGTGGAAAPAADLSRCNGLAVLCDRPLDEVTFPATHNAMSAPQPGWFSSLQEEPIAVQLADGIRGLLLDTHYGDRLSDGRVRTAFDSPADIAAAVKQDGVSEQSAAAALRLRARLGFRGEGDRGMYLCHTFCELGATPLRDALDQIQSFLVTNPGEVLDRRQPGRRHARGLRRRDRDAGLADYAITPPAAGEAWPTLRELIDSDRRLLVMAEDEAGAAPWYQPAYERLLQETPYEFPRPADLLDPARLPASCEPNRGPDTAPLFLLNHWVGTDPAPRPSNAARVNAYEPLLRRAARASRSAGGAPTCSRSTSTCRATCSGSRHAERGWRAPPPRPRAARAAPAARALHPLRGGARRRARLPDRAALRPARRVRDRGDRRLGGRRGPALRPPGGAAHRRPARSVARADARRARPAGRACPPRRAGADRPAPADRARAGRRRAERRGRRRDLLFVTTAALRRRDPELEALLAHGAGHHRGLHPVATALVWWLSLPGEVLAAAYGALRRLQDGWPGGSGRSPSCSPSCCCSGRCW